MALTITDDCINCGDCESECPNHAISSGEDIFTIDPDKCTECVGHFDESQCIKSCRYDCITVDPDRTESEAQLREKFAALDCLQ